MPKKVITRRQRKAAEAKRQSDKKGGGTPAETFNGNMGALPTTVQPSSSCPKPKASVVTKVQQATDAAETELGKATVRIIVNDKKATPDKKVLDLLVDENIKKKATNPNLVGGLQPPCGPPIEQGSFSKSLTRRAAATITKIQKLSKAFNKKINYKQTPPQAAESTNPPGNKQDETTKNNVIDGSTSDKNKPCNCEFCKVVLSQLLAGKKRANEKKNCKNSRRQANQRRTESPGHLLAGHVQENCEECKLQPPLGGHRRRLLQLMEVNERELERNVRRRIKELKKFKSNRTAKESEPESKPKMNEPKHQDNPHGKAFQPQPSISHKSEIVEHIQSKPKLKQLASSKDNFFNVMQQLSVAPVEAAPVKILGNTGYFVLTGTDVQLASQLNDLQAKNVHVQKCMLLTPGVTENLEQQLEKLNQNREEILKQMRDKYNLVDPRRQKRQKKQRKCR